MDGLGVRQKTGIYAKSVRSNRAVHGAADVSTVEGEKAGE